MFYCALCSTLAIIIPGLQPGGGRQLRPTRLAGDGQEMRRTLLIHEEILRFLPRRTGKMLLMAKTYYHYGIAVN